MKKQILILAALAIAVLQFWGCSNDGGIFGSIKGSGNIVDVGYNYDNFERVDVSHAFALTVIEADTFFVNIRVDDNLVKYLKVSSSGGWLSIGMEDGHSYNNAYFEAEVHMPEISELHGSGASAISLQSFSDTTDFKLDLSGASVFNGLITADNCEILLSGASVVDVNGICTDFYLDASGASVIKFVGSCADAYLHGSGASYLDMGSFITNTVNADFSGATDGTINVSDHLDAKLSGASILKYYGDPVLGNIDISGASVLTKL